MPKRFYKFFPILFLAGELSILATSFYLAQKQVLGSFDFSAHTIQCLGLYLATWFGISLFLRDFKIGRTINYQATLKRAVISLLVFWSAISILRLLFEQLFISRELLISIFVQLFFLISFYRIFVHIALVQYRKLGGNVRRAVIIGYDSLGLRLYDIFNKKPHYGIKCEGFYDNYLQSDNRKINVPVLGKVEDFFGSDISNLDLIYVSEKIDRSAFRQIINLADSQLKKVKLIPQFNTDLLKTYTLSRFEDVSIVDINNLPLDSVLNRFLKRGFDMAFSLFVMVTILSWLYPIIALLIKLESKGPVLFKQWRHGKGTEPFVCYKFRTMVINDQADQKWATKDDPRITKVGAFLRRTSLDEFPQFINVWRGEMSIVGPRPHPIPLNKAYQDKVYKFTQRHASRPGITGLAQALGYRGEIQRDHQMNSRVKLDRFYLQNWSFVLDIKIIFLTIYSVLFERENAY
jgi:putative colanic acid biosysnthesis UDP-glucose lipid carrier transferase